MSSFLSKDNFSLGIPQGRDLSQQEMYDLGLSVFDGKYVAFEFNPNGIIYGIAIRNNWNVPCEVELLNQGEYIGTFRLEAKGHIQGLDYTVINGIEGGGNFIHYPDDTQGASDSGQYKMSDQVRGLVRAIFYPDQGQPHRPIQRVGRRHMAKMSKGGSITTLGGRMEPQSYSNDRGSSDRSSGMNRRGGFKGAGGFENYSIQDSQPEVFMSSSTRNFTEAVGGTTGQIGTNTDVYMDARPVTRGPEYRLSLRIIFVMNSSRHVNEPRPLYDTVPPPIRRRRQY